MSKLVDGWRMPTGLCPKCFYDGRAFATFGENGYVLTYRCFCRSVNEGMPWPFKKNVKVTSKDFEELGFTVEIAESYSNYLDWQDEQYNREIDHGWEDALLDGYNDW